MDLVCRGALDARRVALLPAAWNPPTLAHLALAQAALEFAGEVLLVLPRVFPHKEFEYAGFDLRLEWLRRIANARAGLGVGVTGGGLFLEMARALRSADRKVEQVYIVCGRDAAERFLHWRYEREPSAVEQLREFSLLVAPRGEASLPTGGVLTEVPHASVHTLKLDPTLLDISSTEVRQRIGGGEPWTHLVPDEIVGEAGGVYR
jgi:nicotinic acid mononucleotide adenylyltransferase